MRRTSHDRPTTRGVRRQMAKNFSVKFSGASHKVYSFDLYNFPGEWGEVAGVYLGGFVAIGYTNRLRMAPVACLSIL